MHCGALHEENGAAAVANELLEDALLVVVGTVLEAGKTAHADDVAVAAHDGNGFEEVFALVAVHDDAALGFELPGTLIDVEDDDVHAEVHGSLLGGEARAQGVVEEDEQRGLVAAEVLPLVAVALHLLRFGKGGAQVADVGYVLENIHIVVYCLYVCFLFLRGTAGN